jgi:ferredoxin
MWTKLMTDARKKPPRKVAVVAADWCFGALACSICQAACPVAGCIIEVPDPGGRLICAVVPELCIGCGLCVSLGNPTALQKRDFGCPPDYDAIEMMPYEEAIQQSTTIEASQRVETYRERIESATKLKGAGGGGDEAGAEK